MYKEHFFDHPLLAWPIVAMALFAAAFALVVVRAWLARPADLDALSAMPLADEGRAP